MRWDKIRSMAPADQRKLQAAKLRQLITRHVAPFSPHYREMFEREKIDPRSIRTLDDLRRIPFASKGDLITKSEGDVGYRNFILQPTKELIGKHWPLSAKLRLLATKLLRGADHLKAKLQSEYKPVWFTATTGRSAEQVLFFYTPYDVDCLCESGLRIMDVVNGPDNDLRVINMFPYAPHLAYWQTYYAALSARAMAVSTGGGKVTNTTSHVRLIGRIKPAMLVGVPSYTYHVLRTAADEGADFSSVNRVVLGAEKVPMGMKEKMLELLGKCGAKTDEVRIMGTYGFTEAKRAWAEAPTAIDQSTGYFTYPDMEIFEVVNPETGEPVGEGETGEIVYTSLEARGSVVLRYRTGDVAVGGIRWSEPCPHTGWRVPRINSHITRVSNQKDVQLTKVKGTLVSLDSMAHVLMGTKDLEEWAVEIRKQNDDPYGLDEVVLYCAPAKGVEPDEALKKKVSEQLASSCEVSPNVIEFRTVSEMNELTGLETEMKEKRFFDRREEQAANAGK